MYIIDEFTIAWIVYSRKNLNILFPTMCMYKYVHDKITKKKEKE